jgi:hypothetical protein
MGLNDSERRRVRWRTLALDESNKSSLAVRYPRPDAFSIATARDRASA